MMPTGIRLVAKVTWNFRPPVGTTPPSIVQLSRPAEAALSSSVFVVVLAAVSCALPET